VREPSRRSRAVHSTQKRQGLTPLPLLFCAESFSAYFEEGELEDEELLDEELLEDEELEDELLELLEEEAPEVPMLLELPAIIF